MSNNKRTIVIEGWFGKPNVGDEAILASVVQLAKYHDPNIEIIAASTDPPLTSVMHDVDAAVPRLKLRRVNKTWLQTIANADELWIGGGGLFCNSGLLQYCQMIAIANTTGTRVVTVGVGASGFPVHDEHADLLVTALNHTDAITTRNEDSANLLRNAGVVKPIHSLADVVFAYQSESTLQQPWSEMVDDGTLVVSVRAPTDHRKLSVETLAQALDEAVNKYNCDILFLPFNNNYTISDRETAQRVADQMKNPSEVCSEVPDFRQLYEIINRAHAVVGMRLHSIIFAARARTPFVGISYRPKCASQLRDLGMSVRWCNNLEKEDLVETIGSRWDNQLPNNVYKRIAEHEQRAKQIPSVISKPNSKRSARSLYLPVARATVENLASGVKNKMSEKEYYR